MQNIDYYIDKVKSENIYGGDERTKAYRFEDDGVVLLRKGQDDFEELKNKTIKCKKLGVNIPEYYDYKITNDKGWLLEDLAPGEEFAKLVNNDEGYFIVNNIPYEHIEKYVNDCYLLDQNGIGIETRRRNIFYDIEKGFTTIDLCSFNNIKDPDSLEEVSYFFDMISPIFRSQTWKDKIDLKQYLNIMKAFENGHPYFKKYSRWIYRGNKIYSTILKEIGYDLTIDNEEYKEFMSLIQQLIDDTVEEMIDNPNYNRSNTNYKEFLAASIDYCPQFSLYDTKEYTMSQYVDNQVYDKIKVLFSSNPEDESLKKIYYRVRRKELDPHNICYEDKINEIITEELNNHIISRGK